jgi:hypothetical protein
MSLNEHFIKNFGGEKNERTSVRHGTTKMATAGI